jgi:hypothetical protein
MKQHKSINSYLDTLIHESIKSTLQRRTMREEEEQEKQVNKDTGDSSDSGETGEKKLPEPEKQKLKQGDVTVDDVIEKLNAIRSGKSFKDESVKSALDEYFEDLPKAERVALVAYLKGISQVLSGEVSGAQALDPADQAPGIEMKKKNEPKTVSIKPNVIKAPDIKKDKSKPSGEDASGPVPISPKKK